MASASGGSPATPRRSLAPDSARGVGTRCASGRCSWRELRSPVMPTRRPPGFRAPCLLVACVSLLAASLSACTPSDPVAEVRDLQAEGSFEASLEPLKRLIETRPDDPEVHYLFGHALFATGQLSLAQFALRKAMESPEWVVPAGLDLAGATILTENSDEAIEATTRILELQPDHLDALLLRGRALAMNRRRYPDALADAERAIEIDPGNVEGLMLRAVSLLGLERIDEAEAAIAELDRTAREAELEPGKAARYCGMRAVFAEEKEDFEAAERLFGECLDAFPAEPVVITEALKFFDERKQPERSLEVLRKALDESPTAAVYRRSLAVRLRESGEVAEAERILREGTEIANPVLAGEAWVDLGNHYHALEDYASAATALSKALEIDGSQDPSLVFDYADALVMAQRYDEALGVARGMKVPAHRDLVEGRVALEQGRPAEALEHFGDALRLWPDNATARYYTALAAEGAGDFERAIAEYRYSIRAGPDATDARLRLARLYAAQGAEGPALEALRFDGALHPAGPDADLLAVHVVARLGRAGELRAVLGGYGERPDEQGAALAAAAEGMYERHGAVAAVRLMRGAKGFDWSEPRNAAALRVYVDCLVEAGEAAEALSVAKAALAKHPDVAAFHASHAAALAGGGAPAEAVRAG